MTRSVVLLGLNRIGEWVNEYLEQQEDVSVTGVISTAEGLDDLVDLHPDLVISAGYRHIVPDEYLDIPPYGAINLHKSYLPHHRGANPNVWSILEEAPAGVSIHFMTSSVDAGPIIDRRMVSVAPDDTARTLYARLEREQKRQFRETWPAIRDGSTDPVEQEVDDGCHHLKKDFVDLWNLDLGESMRVGDCIDLLRALTFPPYENAHFTVDGEKYYLEIDIWHEDDDRRTIVDSERVAPTYPETDGDSESADY